MAFYSDGETRARANARVSPASDHVDEDDLGVVCWMVVLPAPVETNL